MNRHTVCNTRTSMDTCIVHLLVKVFTSLPPVIETLDGMKKGKENYLAREAIKFLEREFKVGSRFVRAQQAGETAQPGRKRLPKQDPNVS